MSISLSTLPGRTIYEKGTKRKRLKNERKLETDKNVAYFHVCLRAKTRRIFEYFLLVYSFKIVKNGSTKKFVTFDFIYLFLPTFVPV